MISPRNASPLLVPARWIGPLATAAAIAVIILARQMTPIPGPAPILLVFVAISGVLAGIAPALISAAVMIPFLTVDASAPGSLFTYDSAALSRLALTALTAEAFETRVRTPAWGCSAE